MIVLIYPLVRAVQVVSLAEVIAAEESSKQEKCDADTLDKIETIVPAPAPQVQIRADLDRAGKNSGDEPAAFQGQLHCGNVIRKERTVVTIPK